jgi:hypothetical protein
MSNVSPSVLDFLSESGAMDSVGDPPMWIIAINNTRCIAQHYKSSKVEGLILTPIAASGLSNDIGHGVGRARFIEF